MSFFTQDFMPGMGADLLTDERDLLWGTIQTWQVIGIKLAAAAVDAGNTPTTTLRRGLVLGQVAATAEFKEYSPSATDGSQIPVGVLYEDVSTLDSNATTVNKFGRMLIAGMVKKQRLIGFDEIVRRHFHGRFIFDDRLVGISGDFPLVVAKATDYTVVAGDNNTLFTTRGAAGNVNFTLPEPAIGLRFRFVNEAAGNLTVTAPTGKLVALNNAAATSIAFSTTSQKIGGSVEIIANENGSKWLAIPSIYSGQTVTVA